MKSLLFSLVVAVTSLVSASAINAADPVQLRVLSYNIHHCEGVDGKLDLERIAKVISAVKPDLVALQEVDQNAKRSKNVDQPAELARLTKMHSAFGANIPLQGGFYGNAILSRFPISSHKNHSLPNVMNGEQRGVLVTEISIPGITTPIQFFCTHLDHRSQVNSRVPSAQLINELAINGKQFSILAGDMNALIGSDTMNLFDKAWKRTNEQPLSTFPVDTPNRQIDYILYRPSEQWKVVETRVLDESVASDHRAIFSVLEHIQN
ncbi:endonuclease/exonuclease/phosphatase family protein [Planctomicrobium sp. SH527]|uniref:endonuclease/exonuclease/phosphatase family protein n=1 Tax=Planctomicrobium sp. SH527 TaxID=3448123 RepID=UPI003F5C94EA